jgi:hypothetical protein
MRLGMGVPATVLGAEAVEAALPVNQAGRGDTDARGHRSDGLAEGGTDRVERR